LALSPPVVSSATLMPRSASALRPPENVGEQSAVERRGGRRNGVGWTAVFVALLVAGDAHAIKTAQRATLRIA